MAIFKKEKLKYIILLIYSISLIIAYAHYHDDCHDAIRCVRECVICSFLAVIAASIYFSLSVLLLFKIVFFNKCGDIIDPPSNIRLNMPGGRAPPSR